MRSRTLVESLENRRLLSGATATFGDGILEIHGTSGNDTLTVMRMYPSDTQIMVSEEDGSRGVPLWHTIEMVNASDVHGILLFAGQGDDLVRVLVDIPATIHGGLGSDTIHSSGGDDLIYGGKGNDLICAGEGNDTVYGGDGTDGIWGYGGNDSLYGKGKADTIYGGTGNDTIFGGAGSDQIHGGRGDDVINDAPVVAPTSGVSPRYVVEDFSTRFHDYIRGGQGNDSILACRTDTVLGCAGRDTFRSRFLPAWPTLGDFDSSEDTMDTVLPDLGG